MSLIKEKLLEIHSLSLFATFTPSQTLSTYNELVQFFDSHSSSLTEQEYYDLLELQFHLALIMGKDEIAKVLLDRINDRFGAWGSERYAVLKIRFLAAVNGVDSALSYIESRVDKSELEVLKSKIALSKKIGSKEDYVVLLKGLLLFNPLDVEVLSELAEFYYELGHFDKAIFTLEELLLVHPYNYIVFAKLGELYHALYKRDSKVKDTDDLKLSLKHFLRSVELCSNFVRGWSGVYVVTRQLVALETEGKASIKYKKLLEVSKKQLQLIVVEKDATEENIKLAEKVLNL